MSHPHIRIKRTGLKGVQEELQRERRAKQAAGLSRTSSAVSREVHRMILDPNSFPPPPTSRAGFMPMSPPDAVSPGSHAPPSDRMSYHSEYPDRNELAMTPPLFMPSDMARIAHGDRPYKVNVREGHDTPPRPLPRPEKARARSGPEPAGRKRLFLRVLRILHMLGGLMLAGCFVAMEAYMLVRQFEIVVIPLSVCRLILVTALHVFILCDWGFPKRIHRYFPMYNYDHSLKPLGLSLICVVFFALADPTFATMAAARGEDVFARTGFAVTIAASSVVAVLALAYFVSGLLGGVEFRLRRRSA
ncbi:hypothetical protein H4R19_001977 [Coemansia spiralis]|nr:hypothetical protein H4R19_001977 [Coemansia spiralis]